MDHILGQGTILYWNGSCGLRWLQSIQQGTIASKTPQCLQAGTVARWQGTWGNKTLQGFLELLRRQVRVSSCHTKSFMGRQLRHSL